MKDEVRALGSPINRSGAMELRLNSASRSPSRRSAGSYPPWSNLSARLRHYAQVEGVIEDHPGSCRNFSRVRRRSTATQSAPVAHLLCWQILSSREGAQNARQSPPIASSACMFSYLYATHFQYLSASFHDWSHNQFSASCPSRFSLSPTAEGEAHVLR